MKKLLALVVLSLMLSCAAGCRIGECWREAWRSRFCPQPQQSMVVSEPCVVSDSCCSPCATQCAPCNAAPATMTPVPR